MNIFNLGFYINIPFCQWEFKSLFLKTWRLSKHKFFECQFVRHTKLISLNLDWSVNEDHAGFSFDIGLLGLEFYLTYYDNRHWNDETNTWEKYE